MNDDTKVMSLRLPQELADEVRAVARTDEASVSETIRAAIYRYVTVRRSERDFKERLKKRLEEDREVLERLVEDG
jgi:Arc/MetJ-type ribon-helix-helix transcriptional regulator